MTDTSIAHRLDASARTFHPDGNVPWRPETPPDIDAGRYFGCLRSCEFCGSMHPVDLAAAIRACATIEWADFKYGFPHKVYVHGVPNPHAGMMEIRSSANFEQPGYERLATPRYDQRTGERVEDYVEWVKKEQAGAKTWGKFYVVHLQDATVEDRVVIERAMGLKFDFTKPGFLSWSPFSVPMDPEAASDVQDAS